MTKNLAANDYPVSVRTNRSLYDLYSQAFEVNHQFLLSKYQETGYFEYDSTQNFAHIITETNDPWFGQPMPGGGTYGLYDFVVYDQLGTTSQGYNSTNTRRHGQFFPFNDLKYGKYVSTPSNGLNWTDIHGNELSSLDPRKGEQLYVIQVGPNNLKNDLPYVDVFFGVEMSASFMQSENGLDSWGHDLIFEFSGDDDFWLYVDGMLVLDLGGVHSAIDGDINFRTGVVHMASSTANNAVITTNLRACYKAAYLENHPGASET